MRAFTLAFGEAAQKLMLVCLGTLFVVATIMAVGVGNCKGLDLTVVQGNQCMATFYSKFDGIVTVLVYFSWAALVGVIVCAFMSAFCYLLELLINLFMQKKQ